MNIVPKWSFYLMNFDNAIRVDFRYFLSYGCINVLEYPLASSVGCFVKASHVGKDTKYHTSLAGLPDSCPVPTFPP